MSETDAVMNAETRRALRRRGRQVGMVVVGTLVAIVIFGVAGLAAILSIPWQLSLAVTVGVTVAIPVAVPYAMLRVFGLSHYDVIFIGKRAYREVSAEIVARRVSQTRTGVFADSETVESGGNPLPAREETESEGESENDSGNENENADESAESDTRYPARAATYRGP